MSLEGTISGKKVVGKINSLDTLTISAYGIAVKNGFQGTEEEWLESLKGKSAQVYVGPGDMPNGYAVQVDPTVDLKVVTTVNGKAPDEYGNVNVSTSVNSDQIASAVESYLEENPVEVPEVDLSGYAKTEDIPVVPTSLPNPHALTFTGAVSATYDGSVAVSVDVPTDAHINSLINTALGVIENGTY